MRIFLNEKQIDANEAISLSELLIEEKIGETNGIAIAVNNQVVPKMNWETTALTENDKIIIITATAGG